MCFGPEFAAVAAAAAPYATAASVGLQLASTMQRASAERKVQKARDSAMVAQAERQRQEGQAMDARLAQTMQETSRPAFDASLAASAGEIEQSIAPTASSIPDAGTYNAGSASAPKEVREDLARRLYDVLQGGKDQAKRRAALNAYGEAQFDQGTAITRGGQDMRNIQANMQGNQSLLPYDLEYAGRKGYGNRVASDILGGAGDLSMIYGIYGKKPAAPGIAQDGGGYQSVFNDLR